MSILWSDELWTFIHSGLIIMNVLIIQSYSRRSWPDHQKGMVLIGYLICGMAIFFSTFWLLFTWGVKPYT